MGFVDWFNRSLHGGPLERVTIIDPPDLLEGTRMSLWNSILPAQYGQWDGSTMVGNAQLIDRTWVASRCQALNAQQVGAMKVLWHGTDGTLEPAWVSSPDPSLFPSGIGDAMYAITDQLYGWGYSLQYVTDFYASGFPRRWTVIPSSACTPVFNEAGNREYRLGGTLLDPSRVMQIDRNPTTAAHGTSALAAYAQRAYSLLAAGNKSLNVSQDAFPPGYLKAEQRLTGDQSTAAREKWMEKTAARAGGVPVLGQGWDFKNSGINPADMALLETQEWDARVICTAYGVPSVALNMAMQGGLTYQNPEALFRMWWLTELRPTAKRIADAFNAQALPAGQWVTVDASDITTEGSVESEDDPQAVPNTAKASPAQQPGGLTAIGGGRT